MSHPQFLIGNQRMRLLLLVCCFTAACDSASIVAKSDPPEPGMAEATRNGPEGAAPGTCWGKTVSPAIIETVSEQVQVKPTKVNPDGTIAQLPVYRLEERQRIVTPRQNNWFETPCSEVLTEAFNSSLQRALSARGIYKGAINGKMNRRTREAINIYQKSIGGADSEVLSLATARTLGLITIERSEAD